MRGINGVFAMYTAAQGVIESLKVLEVRVEPIIPMIVGV